MSKNSTGGSHRGEPFGSRPPEVEAALLAKSHSPESRAKADATRKAKKEVKEIIRMIMGSPVTDKEMNYVDGKLSIEHFKGKNTDAQTRIILQMTLSALRGNQNAAEFLMKYGGYEPPKTQNINIDRPTIIDDFVEPPKTAKKMSKPLPKDPTDAAEIAAMTADDDDE